MSTDGQCTKRRRNIAENFNRLSRAHDRFRQTDDRRTDGQRHTRSLKSALRISVLSVTYDLSYLSLLEFYLFFVMSFVSIVEIN